MIKKKYIQQHVVFFLKLIVFILSMTLSPQVFAHPNHDKEDIQILLYKWANGMQSADVKALKEILADDFKTSTGKSRERFLFLLEVWNNLEGFTFSLNNSMQNKLDTGFLISPIVVSRGAEQFFYSVSVKKYSEVWKINSLTYTTEIPADLTGKFKTFPLPEQFMTFPVTVNLYDTDSGDPVYARVHIADEKGEYWPPQGHQKYIPSGFRKHIGGDVQIGNKVFAYIKPNFTIDLPVGKYSISVAKGMEYTPETLSFTVTANRNNKVDLRLKRWVNMRSQDWYAGDTHTHFINDHNALLEAEAEGLNIVSVLATKWGLLITDIAHVTGEASPVSRPDHIIFYNEETRHNFLGHTILHPIKEPVYPLTWGGPEEGVANGTDYPAMAHQADKAHAQGAMVTWAHIGLSRRGELAVDVALGKIDSFDVFTWGNAFLSSKIDKDGKKIPSAVQWWYKFLNTGARIPVGAGTDKMFNDQIVGSLRTYVYLNKEKLTYRAWAEAIQQGNSFVTTGPMISLKANGQRIGSVLKLDAGDEVLLEAEVTAPYDRFPWDRFEIIQNGEVIASHSNPDKKNHLALKIRVKPSKAAWFAVRVYDSKGTVLPETGRNGAPAMAHSSPVYVEIPHTEIWNEEDADFLAEQCEKAINWAKNKARYDTEAQRQEIVALFTKARALYRRHR